MLIYFTGTGNSRFLANLLSTQLNDEIVDATQHIKNGTHPAFQSDKPYVFVAPTYAWRMPRLLEEWMLKCRFEGSQKVYFVLNCGSEIGASGTYAKRLCRKIGMEYMGTAEVIMPENYIAMFTAPTWEESQTILREAEAQIPELAAKIAREEALEQVKITLVGRLCSSVVNPLFYRFSIRADKFLVKDTCISCGKCAKDCMLNNIVMKDGRPVWGSDCTHCMACICGCPKDAIEYGKRTVGLRRYTLEKQRKNKE